MNVKKTRGDDALIIYTSFSANLRNIPENIISASICAKAPEWFKGAQYRKLAQSIVF